MFSCTSLQRKYTRLKALCWNVLDASTIYAKFVVYAHQTENSRLISVVVIIQVFVYADNVCMAEKHKVLFLKVVTQQLVRSRKVQCSNSFRYDGTLHVRV